MNQVTIEVDKLPIIRDVRSDDYILVVTQGKLARVKFDDFVVGSRNVSFYNTILDTSSNVSILSTNLAQLSSQVT